MTSLVRLKSLAQRLEPAQVRADGVAAAHRAQDVVVARLERHVQVAARGRRLAQRADELVVDVVDLDRGEAESFEPRCRAGLPDEPRQAIAGGAVAVAAEVDPGEDDLAVALGDAAADLAEHGLGRAAARGAAHERDDAEAACERAAVLHLDEGANAVEAGIRLHAADRTDVARDELRRLLAAARDHDDVLGQPGERVPGEVRAAARDVHAAVGARRAGRLLAGLRDGFVGDAARVDDGHVGTAVALLVTIREQPLAHRVRVDVRDLAAEEADGERRHGRNSSRSAAQPSRTRRSSSCHPSTRGSSRSR